MKRMHVHVGVADLDQSIGFYSTLFGAPPAVVKSDYAKWMLEDPRLNFAISAGHHAAKGIEHLGIQAETGDELVEVYDRLHAAGRQVLEEGATTCCYAKSEKSWIADPDGVVWEAFHTSGEATVYGEGAPLTALAATAAPGNCCAPAPSDAPRQAAAADMPVRNVLFLCTGNSARSILAEALLEHRGEGRFRGYSAGSQPKGAPHPMALALLAELGIDVTRLRSKSWAEFATAGAPQMDLIITVCDNAAGESCPIWPGHPVTAHWGLPDPAAIDGADQRAAFEAARNQLERRIAALLQLPVDTLDPAQLRERLREIGRIDDANG